MPLSPPPRSVDGEVVPHDHQEIKDEHRVIRRLSSEFVVPDPKAPSGRRVASMAFEPSSGGSRGLSVDLEASILEAGLDPRQFVTTPRFMGSVVFSADFLRSATFKVGYDPVPDNAHHGEVWGNFNRSAKKKLLDAAEWFVAIPGTDLRLPPVS